MKQRYLLVMLCLFAVTMLQAKGIKVETLSTDGQTGLAVVEVSPRLGWVLSSAENGTRQTAYEIELREAYADKLLWSSGKVASDNSVSVSIDAAKLNEKRSPAMRSYRWRVRVWDEADIPSAWSSEAAFCFTPQSFGDAKWIGAITREDARLPEGRKFQGGVLKKPEVKAMWEAVDTLSSKSIALRKPFEVKGDVSEAILCISGLGNYELSLNGKKVGDSEFAPLWSDFDKTVYYNTYDVTTTLRRGENVAGVWLGNGFYNVQGGRGRYTKLKGSFGPPTLLFQLHICYADGTVETINSSSDWKYAFSPITFNCIYGGESYDARLEQKGWNAPKFDDSRWHPAVVQEAPKGTLRPQQTTPVTIMERYGVKSFNKLSAEQVAQATVTTKRTVSPSAIVFDMGQNLAGFPEIVVRGKKGQKITLLVGESLTAEGAVNQRQTGRQHYYEYTLKGEGDEVWHPRFSYYGFRYIQVEGAVRKGDKNPEGLPLLKELQSCFIYNSAPKISTFETSNSLFNATHRLIEKAVRSNMQAVFTDCPHREKLGWLEQVHLNGPGLLYNYDLRTYGRKVMRDIADAQRADGAVPSIAPQYVIFEGPGMDDFAESPEWGSTLVIFPFMYYNVYGDNSLIRTYYRNMRAYVDYLTTRADHHILSFGLGDWYDYGDFKAGFSRNTPVPLVATAYYYMDLCYMRQAALMVGNSYDHAYYSELSQEVARAFNKQFFNEETGQYGTGSQCSNALPLYLGLTQKDIGGMFRFDEEWFQSVLNHLVADVKSHGNRLTTGDVGNRYLFQTLANNGQNELLYTMMNHYETPGYGFQLKFGATTLTEQWDPRQGSSWNHFMMGQVDEWFFNTLVGISPLDVENGYKHILVRPQPVGDLTAVKGSTETPYGKVEVEWTRQDNCFTLRVSVPVNTTATVMLPSGEIHERLLSGTHSFTTLLSQ